MLSCLFLSVPILPECPRHESGESSADSIIAPFAMPFFLPPAIPQRVFDIRVFGAKEGGAIKNTRAIQKAIDSAAALGGGVILVPAGRWLTGALHLGNNTDLRLSKNAELLFSQEVSDYLPAVFSRHEDIECYKYSSFIHAEGKTNIAITGEGTLNGQGKPWWSWKETKKDDELLLNKMATEGMPVEQRLFDGTGGRQLRPAFFQPVRCANVLVEGVTFLYGAFWTITPTYCENVIVRNVRIETQGAYGHAPNGDGVDPSSCRNVLIENCDFSTGDDCIAIKAGRDADGLRVAVVTENIVVRNCRGFNGHGGIVIGSETSGGIRNVYAVNCQFKGTDRIVRIKTARGRGGTVENLWFKDLSGEDIAAEAIHLNMLYTGARLPAQPVSPATPSVRNIHFDNISCASGKSCSIEILGLPEMPVENVWFNRVDLHADRGVNISDARGIHFDNPTLSSQRPPLITITDGVDISFDAPTFPGDIDQLLRVEGTTSRMITIRGTNIQNPEKRISLGSSVSQQAVLIEE